MSRIFYGKNPPRSFCEEMHFDSKHPYYIRIKSFQNDDIAPPHYSDDTLELMLCRGVTGKVTVGDKQFDMRPGGSSVIVVPPGIVHSNYITRCGGSMFLLHVSIRHSSKYIGIENLMSFPNLRLEHLLHARPRYEEVISFVQHMIEYDENIFRCLRELLSIVELLCASIPSIPQEPIVSHDAIGSEKLRKLIQWTSERYTQRVTLEMAAGEMGFSTTYFCSWFKKITGMTYILYLNQVRVMQACRCLNAGMPLKEAAYACGFEDISYFIQLFKKIQGCTPKSYVKNQITNAGARQSQIPTTEPHRH
jgi:AraC-like DNA-binding protein